MEKQRLKGQYYGPHEITGVTEVDEKTYLGHEKVCLELENGDRQSIPWGLAKEVVSEGPVDWSELRNRRTIYVTAKVLEVLVDAEVTKDEIQHIANVKLSESIRQNWKRCHEKFWGKQLDDVTLLDMEKVLNDED